MPTTNIAPLVELLRVLGPERLAAELLDDGALTPHELVVELLLVIDQVAAAVSAERGLDLSDLPPAELARLLEPDPDPAVDEDQVDEQPPSLFLVAERRSAG